MYLFDLKGLFGRYKTFAIEPDGYCRVAWRNRKTRSEVIEKKLTKLFDLEIEGFSNDIFQTLMNGEYEESFESLKWAEECFDLIKDNEEFHLLQEMCVGDPDFAAVSTGDFMEKLAPDFAKIKEYSDQMEKLEKKIQQESDDREKRKLGLQMKEVEFRSDQCKVYAKAKAQKTSIDSMKKVSELHEMKRKGFLQQGDGGDMDLLEQQNRWDLIDRFQKDTVFKLILKLAGRIQRLGDQAVVEQVDTPEEFVGFTSGNNFDGIQLEDLTMMNDEDLENLFWAEFCDETLLVDLFKGTKQKSKGDIVIVSDVSGSMAVDMGNIDGEPISRHMLCRAFCFAAMTKCKKENRRTIDISFASTIRQKTSNPHESLNVRCGGGTRFNTPLLEALTFIEKADQNETADIIFITDGESSLNTYILDDIKGKGIRLWLYTIGNQHNYYLHKYAHRSFLLKDLNESLSDLSHSIKDK